MAQQYDEQIQHVAEGERILTAVDGCTIVQTADGAVALTADARIALGPATHAACCWRDAKATEPAPSPSRTTRLTRARRATASPSSRPRAWSTPSSAARSVAPQLHVTGAAFRAGDGALGVLYGDGALRVALLGLDGGRVVEEAACVSTAAAAARRSPSSATASPWARRTGACAVVKARPAPSSARRRSRGTSTCPRARRASP